MDGADVGMIQGLRGFRFTAKSFEGLAVMGKVFGQEFESDEAVKSSVFGFVDHAHSPATELFDDSIMRDGLAYERGRVRHKAFILGWG